MIRGFVRLRAVVAVSVLCLFALTSVSGQVRSASQGRTAPQAEAPNQPLGPEFEEIFAARILEADEFYATVNKAPLTEEETNVIRQCYAGLL